MRRFRVVASAALIVLALAGSACTSTGNESGGGAGDAAAAATAAASFDVSLTDQLKIDPAMIDAPSDTPLTFNVTNTGAGQHSFAVEAGDQTYQTRCWMVAAPPRSRFRRYPPATTPRCARSRVTPTPG